MIGISLTGYLIQGHRIGVKRYIFNIHLIFLITFLFANVFSYRKINTLNHSFFQKVEIKGAFPQSTQRAQHPPQPNPKFLIENKKRG